MKTFVTGLVTITFLLGFFGMPKFRAEFDNHVLAVGEPGTPITKQAIERIVDERIEAWHAAHPDAHAPRDLEHPSSPF